MLSPHTPKRAYLAVPIQGVRLPNTVYEVFSQAIHETGLEIANPHVLKPAPVDVRKRFQPADIYREDVRLLHSSDILIAEISSPSLGVGYEIATAEGSGLPIVCAYQSCAEQNVSLMILGITYPKLLFVKYSSAEDLQALLQALLASFSEVIDA